MEQRTNMRVIEVLVGHVKLARPGFGPAAEAAAPDEARATVLVSC